MWQKWVAPSSTSQGGNPGNRKGPAGKAAQLKRWNSMQGDGDLLENAVNIKQWGGGWGIRCEGYYWLHHHHATPLGDRPDIETSWTSCMHIFQSMSVHTDFVQQILLCSKSKFLPWSFGLNGGRLAKISIKWICQFTEMWGNINLHDGCWRARRVKLVRD